MKKATILYSNGCQLLWKSFQMVVVMFIIDQQPAAQFDVHGVHLPDQKK